jgi:hypothetical protein
MGDKGHVSREIGYRGLVPKFDSLTVHYPDNEVRLTTMQVGPPNLSLRFDDNLGSDFKHFYRGP